jgi:trehalose utilization protein
MVQNKKTVRIKSSFFTYLIVFIICGIWSVNANSIHVLIWDERQPEQKEVYDDWLGNEIARQLKTKAEDFVIRSVGLNDNEQGLSSENLDWADVIIWWGHIRQWEISPETAKRKLIKRLKSGKLNMIFLHSAHESEKHNIIQV